MLQEKHSVAISGQKQGNQTPESVAGEIQCSTRHYKWTEAREAVSVAGETQCSSNTVLLQAL